MPDNKTVTFDASHRALIERAAKIIQAGADSLKEAHCLNGDWRDSDLARRDYYDELAVVGQLCKMLASLQSADHSGEATEKVDHFAELRNMVDAQGAGQEAVAEVRDNPDDIGTIIETLGERPLPVGTKLYAAPVNGGGRDTVEVAVALEQQRTLAIVKAVRDINFGESPTGMPTPASAAYDLACEEIERRVRTEQWELDGAAAPLPSAERAADAQQASATNARLLRALEEIVKNDPFNQSSAGVIARAALASPAKVGDDGLIEQHHRDSAELRRLCEARDQARRTAEYWKANHLAGNAEIERLKKLLEAKVGGDELEAYRADMIAAGAKDLGNGTWEWDGGDFLFKLWRQARAALSEPPLEPSERHALDSACADIAAVHLALELPEEDADGVDAILEAIEELKRRAALSADGGEDKRDAERYRWLRGEGFERPAQLWVTVLYEGRPIVHSDLDAAIDAAIAANQAKGDAS